MMSPIGDPGGARRGQHEKTEHIWLNGSNPLHRQHAPAREQPQPRMRGWQNHTATLGQFYSLLQNYSTLHHIK